MSNPYTSDHLLDLQKQAKALKSLLSSLNGPSAEEPSLLYQNLPSNSIVRQKESSSSPPPIPPRAPTTRLPDSSLDLNFQKEERKRLISLHLQEARRYFSELEIISEQIKGCTILERKNPESEIPEIFEDSSSVKSSRSRSKNNTNINQTNIINNKDNSNDFNEEFRYVNNDDESSKMTHQFSSHLESLYSETLPISKLALLSLSGPSRLRNLTNDNEIYSSNHSQSEETSSVVSFTSSIHSVNNDRVSSYRREQLESKSHGVSSIVSLLGGSDIDKLSVSFYSMSSSPEKCDLLKAHHVVPLLVQLLSLSTRQSTIIRFRLSKTLFNILSLSRTSCKKEVKVLRYLEVLRMYNDILTQLTSLPPSETLSVISDFGCEPLNVRLTSSSSSDGSIILSDFDLLLQNVVVSSNYISSSSSSSSFVIHVEETLGCLTRCSFDEGHRVPIFSLGGISVLADLIRLESLFHSRDNLHPNRIRIRCNEVRRFAVVALTNLTFGNSVIKSFLTSYESFIPIMVSQLESPFENLRKATGHLFRNLAWKADRQSKEILSSSSVVSVLLKLSMNIGNKEKGIESQDESSLKILLSALWNLSAHCRKNKEDICSLEGSLSFLVHLLKCNITSIVENSGGILRNISNYIATSPEGNAFRSILRQNGCLPILLAHLTSSSLTIVSNACGTLWNLSARHSEDQLVLNNLGAVPMLTSLTNSKHKTIATCSLAALKNLTSLQKSSRNSSISCKENGNSNEKENEKEIENENENKRKGKDNIRVSSLLEARKRKNNSVKVDSSLAHASSSEFSSNETHFQNFVFSENEDLEERPTDYSARFQDSDEDDEEGSEDEEDVKIGDTIKTYCTEDTPYTTPYLASTATSLGELRLEKTMSPPSLEEEDQENRHNRRRAEEIPTSKSVNFTAQQTPLMFSRTSSFESLGSFEQHSLKESSSCDVSRLNSGVVSPSDLPDSPCQSPSPPNTSKPEKKSLQNPSSSNFNFNENDDNLRPPLITEEDEDEDIFRDSESILEAVISSGMPNAKKHTSHRRSSKIRLSVPSSISSHGISSDSDSLKIFKTENTPGFLSLRGSTSNLSALTIEEEDEDDDLSVLEACIASAMPSKKSLYPLGVREDAEGAPSSSSSAKTIKSSSIRCKRSLPIRKGNCKLEGGGPQTPFFDTPKYFASEGTPPILFSRNDSLSSLSVEEEEDEKEEKNEKEKKNEINRPKSDNGSLMNRPAALGRSSSGSSQKSLLHLKPDNEEEEEEDENDLLADVIYSGMPKSKSAPSGLFLSERKNNKKKSVSTTQKRAKGGSLIPGVRIPELKLSREKKEIEDISSISPPSLMECLPSMSEAEIPPKLVCRHTIRKESNVSRTYSSDKSTEEEPSLSSCESNLDNISEPSWLEPPSLGTETTNESTTTTTATTTSTFLQLIQPEAEALEVNCLAAAELSLDSSSNTLVRKALNADTYIVEGHSQKCEKENDDEDDDTCADIPDDFDESLLEDLPLDSSSNTPFSIKNNNNNRTPPSPSPPVPILQTLKDHYLSYRVSVPSLDDSPQKHSLPRSESPKSPHISQNPKSCEKDSSGLPRCRPQGRKAFYSPSKRSGIATPIQSSKSSISISKASSSKFSYSSSSLIRQMTFTKGEKQSFKSSKAPKNDDEKTSELPSGKQIGKKKHKDVGSRISFLWKKGENNKKAVAFSSVQQQPQEQQQKENMEIVCKENKVSKSIREEEKIFLQVDIQQKQLIQKHMNKSCSLDSKPRSRLSIRLSKLSLNKKSLGSPQGEIPLRSGSGSGGISALRRNDSYVSSMGRCQEKSAPSAAAELLKKKSSASVMVTLV